MEKKIIFFTAISLFACGCAQISPLRGKESLIWDVNSYPTANNMNRWLPFWDGSGWLIGFQGEGDLPGQSPSFVHPQALTAHIEGWLSQNVGPLDVSVEPILTKPFETPPTRSLAHISSPLFPEETSPENVSLAFVQFPKARSFLSRFSALLEPWAPPQALAPSHRHRAAWYQNKVLGTLPGALWVEPNLISRLATTSPLPDLTNINTDAVRVLKRMKVPEAYALAGNRNLPLINIAVFDTGVDSEHPLLKKRMWVNPHLKPNPSGGAPLGDSGTGYTGDLHGIDATLAPGKTDPLPPPYPGSADLGGPGAPCPQSQFNDVLSGNCGHGTHVAGIIAAEPSPSGDVAGICPPCRIMSIRVSERLIRPPGAFGANGSYEVDGGISDVAQIRGLNYLLRLRNPKNTNELLVNGINMSLGKYFRSRSMYTLVRNLLSRNVLIVAAAGNDNTETPSYPAAYGGVLAVCALGEDITKFKRGIFGKAVYSNFGDWVDVCVPGTEILSTVPGVLPGGSGLTDRKSGTSQAAPYAMGALGFMLSYFGNKYTAQELIDRLKTGANDIIYSAPSNINSYEATFPNGSKVYLLGTGIVDVAAAIEGKKQNSQGKGPQGGPSRGCVAQSIGKGAGLWAGVGNHLWVFGPLAWVFLKRGWQRRRLRGRGASGARK